MIKRFLASGRSGFYLSVIEPGEVRAGANVEILSRDRHRVAIADISALFLNETHEPDLLERATNHPGLSDHQNGGPSP
jgi:MOSC domain-containing protein YiiM